DTRALGILRDRQHLRGRGDLALLLAIGYRVENDQTAHEAEFGRVFDAQRTHAHDAPACAALIGIPRNAAVVEERTLGRVHADVAGTVELRLDLADLGGDQFVVIRQRVLPERAAGGRAGNRHLPAARAEGGRLAVIELANRNRLV